MKGKIAGLVLVIVIIAYITATVRSQDAEEFSIPEVLNEAVSRTAVCGDGVCDNIEKGVCFEDCGGRPPKPESEPEEFVLPKYVYLVLILIAGPLGFVLVVFLFLHLISWRKEKNFKRISAKPDMEEAVGDVRNYIKAGYTDNDIMKILINRGFEQEEANKIISYAKGESRYFYKNQ